MPGADCDRGRRTLLKGAFAAAAAAAVPRAGAHEGIVALRGGRVRGLREDGVWTFRGLRYGEDTAPNRFRPPRAAIAWHGVRDAVASGPAAAQTGALGPGSEDCLFLDLWTPAPDPRARRPVLVYLHGGGYDRGRGADPLTDGGALCRHGDVVVATLNHRLNAFGHLFLGNLDPAFAASGNAGLLDVVLALCWVRDEIAAFGGDPGNVTLFGQSGGGAKIASLMAMPAAAGLFHRAWTMSGQQVTAAGPRAADRRARLYLDALGIAPDALDRLLALPAERLLDATRVRDPSPVEDIALYFGPVLDGGALPRHPFWPDAPPQSATIPMVIGNTRDETRAFLGHDPALFALDWDALPARLERAQYVDLPVADVIAAYRAMYPAMTATEVFFAATTAGRSWRGAVEELEARARQGAPTWAYQLDWPSPVEGGRLRAFHTLDIPLVFGTVGRPGDRTGGGADAWRVSADMRDALLHFARHGTPAHPRLPDWPRYGLAQRETMRFDDPPALAHDPRGGERRLFARAPFVQRGTL